MLLDDKTVQRALKEAGLYAGLIDGDFGPKSIAATREFVRKKVRGYHFSWSPERCRFATEQQIMSSAGFDLGEVDGVVGPRTQIALEKFQDWITFVRPSPAPEAGVLRSNVWPRHITEEMNDFYGKPGTNHTRIAPPYPVYYGDQQVDKILINAACAESALRILNAVKGHYGETAIHELGLDRFGGCYNNRPMRGGAKLSTHAWACAWDWDAARNPLRATSKTAQFAKPDYKAFLDIHEAEGWIVLGRARNFDWMHQQAARL